MLSRRTLIRSTAAIGASLFLPGTSRAATSAGPAGYFYPDEAGPHERTFMQWPVNRTVYSDPAFLEKLQETIANIANTISKFEPVVMLMGKEHEELARKLLGETVEIWDIPTDDLWARDSGPSFVIDGKGGLGVTQFNFNGWGNKQAHDKDGKIAVRVAERLKLTVFDAGLVGEGGGVASDGAGMLLAHESSWVNPNRNMGDRADIERRLLETMGAKMVIWAPGVRDADKADYPIHTLARFVRPGVAIFQLPDEVDEKDPRSTAAFETYSAVESRKSLENINMQLAILPEPLNPRNKAEEFLASYVNYYVCNGALIAAEYGDEAADKETKQILTELYPGREIVMLNVDALGEIRGGIHRVTMQQPQV
ncbi:MAG: agmatine deiminase family protein [Rhizobiaceae bacterium]